MTDAFKVRREGGAWVCDNHRHADIIELAIRIRHDRNLRVFALRFESSDDDMRKQWLGFNFDDAS